ncbi:COG2081 Predicted flavoproteins [Sphingomonadaceae bacterium]
MKAGNYNAIILGAGGAGLMAALTVGQRGHRVLVIDHASGPGKKILISGGGRCNFTNVHATSQNAQDRYISANPHFAKSALGRYEPQDFIDLVAAHGIAFHEKTLGQLFCDGSARQIVAMLMDECDKAVAMGGRVDFAFGLDVRAVSHDGSNFAVSYGNLSASAPRLIVATGGPSIPKMGATGFAYDIARQFGLKVVEPRPALVPLTLGGDDVLFRELSGVSAEVIAGAGKSAFREAALFTHKGLSGPAILQASSYWSNGDPIQIDFLPGADAAVLLADAKRANPRATLRSTLERHLPARLAEALAGQLAMAGNLADQSDRKLADAGARLDSWMFHPNGSEGYAKAEVTRGGVSTDGLSQKTLEAKTVPGLHFIGEAVDVTGWLGGYNFQWAWASGVAVGQAL